MAASKNSEGASPPHEGNGHSSASWSRLRGRRRDREASMRAYRRLVLQLQMDLGEGEGGRVIMLTCPSSLEAAAQAAAELAEFLAQDQGQRVLIVDACLDDPLLSGVLGLEGAEGFSDLLADPDRDPDSVVVSEGEDGGVDFLAAGRRSQAAARALAAGACERLMDRLRERYDHVLMAAGPLAEDPTAIAAASSVDCVLVLAIEDETRVDDIERTRQTLADREVKKVGLVMTSPPRGRLRRLRARS